jgi:hypothetical protein
MKNTYPFLLLLLPIWAVAQPKIVRQTHSFLTAGGWRTNFKIEYRYDPAGHEILRSGYFLNQAGKWEPSYRETNEFDGAGYRLKYVTEQKFSDSTGLYTRQIGAYEYQPNGCLSSQTYQLFEESGDIYDFTKSHYFSDNNCRTDSIVIMSCGYAGGGMGCVPQENTWFKYSVDGKTVTQYFGYWSPQPGVFVKTDNYGVSKLNEEGDVIEHTNYFDGNPQSRVINTYHDDGSKASSQYFNIDSLGGWELFYHDSVGYENEFDNDGFLVRQQKTFYYLSNGFSTAQDYRFINYCDGLPRHETLNDQSRTTYEYEAGIDCDIDPFFPQPTVAPNPANDCIGISYPPLAKGNVTVWLFNALGSEAVGYTVNYRTYDVEVDVSRLPIGIYFLQMVDGKRKFGEKILIMR